MTTYQELSSYHNIIYYIMISNPKSKNIGHLIYWCPMKNFIEISHKNGWFIATKTSEFVSKFSSSCKSTG